MAVDMVNPSWLICGDAIELRASTMCFAVDLSG